MEQLAALATPGATTSSKRKNVPKSDAHMVASASTTASSTEKVTPDPKHIRTGDGDSLGVPEPKVLFVSPYGREAAHEAAHEGGAIYLSIYIYIYMYIYI